MSQAKPGDVCDLASVMYVGNAQAPDFGGHVQPGGPRFARHKQVVKLFEPERSAGVTLICKDNSSKELNYLLHTEYN